VSNVLNRLDYLKHGLAVLLFFIGIKMLLPMFNKEWTIPTQYSLLIICIIIGVSIFFSFTARYLPQKKTAGRKDLKL
jgi:tellurite resistance protein TerC